MGGSIADRAGMSDPCPCGSGRKYRNCCRNADRRAYAVSRAAVTRAVDDLVLYTTTSFRDAMDEVFSAVAADACERNSEEEVSKAFEENTSFLAPCFLDIAIADFELKGGGRVLDRYRNEKGPPSDQMARIYLQSWRERGLSLYEVMSVVPRKSFIVMDAFNKREFKVTNAVLSEALQEGEAFFGRIVRVGELNLVALSFLPVDPCELDHFPEECRRIREQTSGSTSLPWDRFFSKHWELIPGYWLDGVIQESRGPSIVNTDGDPVEAIRVRCRLRPGTSASVESRLLTIPGLSKTEASRFLYHCQPSEKCMAPFETVLVASMRLAGDEIIVEVNSKERASRVEALLSENLGDAILSTSREAASLDDMCPEAADGEDRIPEEEKAGIICKILDQHYRIWLDTPIPALNNVSPRKASHDRRMRPRLVRLLAGMESIPSTIQAGYDTSWIWKELGLERPRKLQ